MATDGFTRDTATVDRALTMAASRRAHIVQAHTQARHDVEQAEADLLAAEQVLLMRERHRDLADREIDGLLAERTRSVRAERQAERMVNAGD